MLFVALLITSSACSQVEPPQNVPTVESALVGLTFTGGNADWTPVMREFDGVPMVLVPAGCFMMGENPQSTDEQPMNEVCFDAPFWIDQYEVTQAQFEQFGGVKSNPNQFEGANRPIEQMTWFEADRYCRDRRGGRLPTEAEWEYAARGVDAWEYPWGGGWDANKAVWDRAMSEGTADVGSLPAGASWVGAFDLSGNVWEWTHSLNLPYPFHADDGREADTASRFDVFRIIRGGAWFNGYTGFPRGGNRAWRDPGFIANSIGVRCAG